MLGTNDKGRVLQGRQAFVEGTLTTTGDSGLVIGVVFPSLVLVTVVTVLRLLVRKTMPPKRLFLDDAWVVVAALLTVALCMVSIEGEWEARRKFACCCVGEHEQSRLTVTPIHVHRCKARARPTRMEPRQPRWRDSNHSDAHVGWATHLLLCHFGGQDQHH